MTDRMRRSLHTDDEIAFLLREAEQGIAVATICASAKVSIGTFYRWRRRLGGLTPGGVARLKQIEEENGRLRAEIAELTKANRERLGRHPQGNHQTPATQKQVKHPLSLAYRGSEVAVGRFAFVRTTH